MTRKVIIDTDPGIDDAVALTMALFNSSIDIVAVTAVAGNVPAQQATRNVQAVIDQLDPPRLPRIGAASDPDGGLPSTSQHLSGKDGLADTNIQVAELHNIHSSEKVIAEAIRTSPGDITILALGPLTNIARAFARDPSCVSQVGQIIMVGGTVASPGNVTPVAEFNMHSDPAAAHQVFRAACTKTLIPLDVTEQLTFNYDFLDELPADSTKVGSFLRTLLQFAFRSHRQQLGWEGIHLRDALAVALLMHPEWFSTRDLFGDVETQGELTKGMTVFDRRRPNTNRPNIEVVEEMESEEVMHYILNCLNHC